MHKFVKQFRDALAELTKVATEVTELCDHANEIVRGLELEDLAELTITLKEARDAASGAKTRCTAVRDNINRHFVVRLEAKKSTQYKTPTHTLSADVEGFFSAPSPKTKPQEFKALVAFLVADGQDPFVVLHGDGLTDYCNERLSNGQNLPPFVSKYLNTTVRVTKRTGAHRSG